MAQAQALRLPTTMGELDVAKEQVTLQDARFYRHWGYVICAVLAWAAFWEFADRHQDRNPHAQLLAWIAVAVAVMVACYL